MRSRTSTSYQYPGSLAYSYSSTDIVTEFACSGPLPAESLPLGRPRTLGLLPFVEQHISNLPLKGLPSRRNRYIRTASSTAQSAARHDTLVIAALPWPA